MRRLQELLRALQGRVISLQRLLRGRQREVKASMLVVKGYVRTERGCDRINKPPRSGRIFHLVFHARLRFAAKVGEADE